MREVKKASNAWAKQHYHGFAWQEGYGAFSVCSADLERIVAYIANQEDHHNQITSSEELRNLLAEYGIEYDLRYFE